MKRDNDLKIVKHDFSHDRIVKIDFLKEQQEEPTKKKRSYQAYCTDCNTPIYREEIQYWLNNKPGGLDRLCIACDNKRRKIKSK